jgi:large subunit ribosomal protein L40
MRAACEELRIGIGDGGRLFRKSMIKTGVFTKGPPIEYGRLQTDSPGQEGWNYEWRS